MCPLRQQQQQRNAQLMWAYKFTHVCPSFCVSVCVCVRLFFGSSIVPILTYPSAAISCRRLCAAEIWKEKEGESAVKFADCTSKNSIHKTIHARALIKKRCRNTHTLTHTCNGACKHATISFIFRFFNFYFNLCFVFSFFFRFLAWKVSFILHALFQLFKIPLDLTLHTLTQRHRHTQRELREQRQNEASVLPADVVLKSVCHCSSLKNQLRMCVCVCVDCIPHGNGSAPAPYAP